MEEIKRSDKMAPHQEITGKDSMIIKPYSRGVVKQILIKMGYPCEDLAGYTEGDPLDISLRNKAISGKEFGLRPYQKGCTRRLLGGWKRRVAAEWLSFRVGQAKPL